MFDPMKLDVEWKIDDQDNSQRTNVNAMKTLSRYARRYSSTNYPEPRSDNAQINVFVDADHIGDKLPKGYRYYSLFS